MIKVVLFDADGVLINQERFSDALARDYDIPPEKIQPFFKKEFLDCLVGNADLKDAISPYLAEWGWTKGVDAILDYWFERENNLDLELVAYVQEVRRKGVKCFVATNQEKYRFAWFLDKLGFVDSFDKAYCAAHLGYIKHDLNFFSKIMGDFPEIRKDEVLLVDNRAENVEAGEKFGFHGILYTTFQNFREKMKEYNL